MTRTELLQLHDETCQTARSIMERKNNDYAGGKDSSDPFANFKMAASIGIHPVTGLLLRMMDKVQRIRTFTLDGGLAVSGESVDDACDDIVNYAILCKGLLREGRTPTPTARELLESLRLPDTYCRATIPPSNEPPYTVEQLTGSVSEPMSETNKSFVHRMDELPYPKCHKCGGKMMHTLTESWCSGCGFNGDDPDVDLCVPDGLPPLPPVPEGFTRWVYRGQGWGNGGKRCTYAHPYGTGWAICQCVPHGRYNTHYVEAVTD